MRISVIGCGHLVGPGFDGQLARAGACGHLPTADELRTRVARALGGERQSEDSTLMST